MKKIFIVFLFTLFIGANANALTFSPTLADISDFGNVLVTGTVPLAYLDSQLGPDDVKFVVNFDGGDYVADVGYTNTGYASVYIGTTSASDLSGFTTYSLFVANYNENPWDFTLYVEDDGVYTLSSTVNLNASPLSPYSSVLSLDLTGISDLSNINYGFIIGADLPLADADYTAEAKVAPVPEPGTLLLLGSGLAGLAFLRRRKS